MFVLKDVPVSTELAVSDEDVLNFIKRRWSVDAKWQDGNCLWFAVILKSRFPMAEICYLGVVGHFIVRIGDSYFDWTGRVEPEERVWTLDEIHELDSSWYSRLMRDCFL